MIRWVAFLVVAGLLTAYTFWVYRRFELAVRGAGALAWLRAAALLLLAALLFDPSVPDFGASGAGARWTLLDASLSMSAGGGDDAVPWPRALSRAQELAEEGWRVVTFGGSLGAGGAPQGGPGEAHTLLAPALERAVEAGARRVKVLTDGRIEDGVAARAALASLPAQVELELFGSDVANAGVSAFRVTDVPRPDRPPVAEVEVHSVAGTGPITLDILEEGRTVASVTLEAPPAGLLEDVTVELPPAAARGRVRYTAVVALPGDGFAADDSAVAYAAVGREEGALVLVSLEPDWEPRFLLPVLGEVTGLPTAGFLRLGADRFAPMGRAVDRTGPVDTAAVSAQVADAALLVVHGLGAGADAWARRLPVRGTRTLVWARDPEGAQLAGVGSVGRPDRGEWYASPDLPASALAGEVAGLELAGLPPVTDVLVLPDQAPGTVPLRVQLRGAGPGQAALYLSADAGGRRAVVLASGFWRWAARDGPARDAYRGLWSGVAGWLLGDPGFAGPEVRPTAWVFERDQPVGWRVPGQPSDSVRLTVARGDSVVTDTLLERGAAFSSGVHAPGLYDFRAEGADGQGAGEGRFDVEARTSEMAFPVAVSEGIASDAPAGAAGEARRPLRTSPWPYLLVIVLLCAEWIGRRRVGLR